MAKSSHRLWQGELKSISSYKWTIYYLDMNNFKLMYIVKVMVFKITFHNSSVTSLRSTLFVEEITVTGGTSSSKALFFWFSSRRKNRHIYDLCVCSIFPKIGCTSCLILHVGMIGITFYCLCNNVCNNTTKVKIKNTKYT